MDYERAVVSQRAGRRNVRMHAVCDMHAPQMTCLAAMSLRYMAWNPAGAFLLRFEETNAMLVREGLSPGRYDCTLAEEGARCVGFISQLREGVG